MPSIRDLPNVLTLARLLMIGPLVWLLMEQRYEPALVLAVVAGLSDWLDGALARRFGWQSRFGGMLDPVADKLLMVSVFAVLAWLGHLPVWLPVLVVLRDVVIVTGGIAYHYLIEPFRAEPTRLSKINTFCQVVLMWTVLAALAGPGLPPGWIRGLTWVVAVMVVVTMFQYVLLWGSRAIAAQHRGRDGHR